VSARRPSRPTCVGVALVAAALLGAACGGGDEGGGSDRSRTSTSVLPAGEPSYVSSSIPDSPAGAQFGWLLEATKSLPIPVPDIEAHFAADFLALVPPDQLNALLAEGGETGTTRFLGVLAMTPTSIDAAIETGTGGQRSVISISVDGAGRIASLLGKPFPRAARVVLGLPPVSLPRPTGPRAVGTETVVATDPARDGRRIPVQLWYPAAGTGDGAGGGSAPYVQQGTATFLAEILGVPLEDVAAIETRPGTGCRWCSSRPGSASPGPSTAG